MIQHMNRFQRSSLVLIIALILFACNGTDRTASQNPKDSTQSVSDGLLPDDQLLIPGKSAGRFLINDPDSTVITALGKPDFSNAAMGKAVLVWYPGGKQDQPLSIFTARDMGNDETARIQQIRITSPEFHTFQAIGVGSSLREISNAYSLQIVETYEQDGQIYTVYNANEGIAFEVDSAYRCMAVIIHKADASIPSYLPLRDRP